MIRTTPLSEIGKGSSYYALHGMLVMIITVVMMLKFSGKPKAFWLFGAAPLTSMAPLFRGALKAFAIKRFVPLFSINAIVFLFIFGIRILPDIMVILLTGLLLIPLSAKAVLKESAILSSFQCDAAERWMVGAAILFRNWRIRWFTLCKQLVSFWYYGVYCRAAHGE